VWFPAVSADVAKVAVPLASAAVPTGVEPSWNVTLPVAVVGLTVAVRVMLWPTFEDEGVTERVVVVDGAPTVVETGLEVLAAFLLSPL
jgi:hypothetical protein